ncbi:acetate--CoA ligase family protein [Rhizobium ruizarguesonis]|uniref:acetate--CoA ligase family protein n=1 Tax=Rhizobium ruizarguesonis TaxID=2081791 RepID=UPI0013BF132D|nr:acetate--CoA ligase family protein [Rhizobium ruizarguesonis]NEI97899.1 CoA-binding protein [Rhizobium ruizarguesonis]NEJ34438.1 CoA-binding protein [Rhizobium ruizarguesonis]
MHIDVSSMVKPRSVAIIGASAKRSAQGNVVINNLKDWGFDGSIVPVHPTADMIEGFRAVNSVQYLEAGTDLAVVAIPAVQVATTLRDLEASGVRAAMIFTNGFSTEDERALRKFGTDSRLIVHGPNCMGLLNFSNAIPLYPARPSLRLRPGKVALVAQSGSAAISVMNSTTVGFSKVITVGSEFQVSAADYLRWLASDDETTVIGVVAESFKNAAAFAEAAECVHSAGKSLIVLKVGRSETGVAATQAHTGALATSSDAYNSFFRETDIATVADYDELIASLECAAVSPKMAPGKGVAIVGISGGQTALACDLAEAQNVSVAAFGEATSQQLHRWLPGSSGRNPVDFGATINVASDEMTEAMRVIIRDEAVGAVVALQDSQESMNPFTRRNYQATFDAYAHAGRSGKPVVVISPTAENVDVELRALLNENRVALIRGIQAGLRAVANLAKGTVGRAGAWASARQTNESPNDTITELKREVMQCVGTLDAELSFRLLRAYEIPLVKSVVVPDFETARHRASEIGYPMVVKIASRDIQHRSDIGAVVLNVLDDAGLSDAIMRIARNVATAAPAASVDGYELQEQFVGDLEAMAGFTSAAPFGPMLVMGTGGTLVELAADRAVGLAPLDQQQARDLLRQTKLFRRLNGYRNLMPKTDITELAELGAKLSRLASDFEGILEACDVNPILVRRETGELRVVDALFIRLQGGSDAGMK